MENKKFKEFYIKHKENQPVGVKTHSFNTITFEWVQTVFSVGDLVAAFQALPNSPLASAFVGDITLHLPDGVDRSASGLGEDCFALTEATGTTLDPGCPLSALGPYGSNSKEPLIIKSKNPTVEKFVSGTFHADGPKSVLFDAENSSSSMQQIEENKSEIKKLQESNSKLQESNSKLQETVLAYIEKAETVHISKLTVERIMKDGYTVIATSVNSITDPIFKIPDEFHQFQWPVKNNEKDKANKEAYLKYLSTFVASFKCLQAKVSIETPHLNTVVGTNPHNLNGEADIYVMPKACHLICRNQLSMVFEMKPNEITSNNLAQAIGYVIAANSLFDVKGRPSPVGVLTDFINQWYLIWISGEGEVLYSCTEVDSNGDQNPLSRKAALYYIQKHLENYNQLLKDEGTKKRKAENPAWAFDGFEAGSLKRQKVSVAEDNMRDLLETEEEIAQYDMSKRMQATPLFQVPPPAEPFSYYS